MEGVDSQRYWVAETWKKILASGTLDADDTAVIYYSLASLLDRLGQLRAAFAPHHNVIHTVAIKTNPHSTILKQIADAGFGLEAASFEEVQLAVAAGAPYDRITYNSPVKTRREIAYCEANYPGLRLNANGLEELERLSEDTPLHIGLRINPLVHAGSSDLYNVSGSESKFGVPIDQPEAIMEHAFRYHIDTLHVHVGSQVADIGKVVAAIGAVTDLATKINDRSIEMGGDRLIKSVNIGGGLPGGADAQSSLTLMQQYVDLIGRNVSALRDNQFEIITEFGQWVHKHNGVVYSRIEYIKQLVQKAIAYIHVGADLFMREAYTNTNSLDFICLTEGGGELERGDTGLFDIAGPLCFNGDYLGKDRLLPLMQAGDIIAIPSTGANTYGLWSRHCSRAVPAIFTDSGPDNRIVKIAGRTYFH